MELRHCSSLEGADCIFLHQESSKEREEIINQTNNMIKLVKDLPEYKIVVTFQNYDEITRRVGKYIPMRKNILQYDKFFVIVFFDGIILENKMTIKAS